MGDLTILLQAAAAGDVRASEQVLPMVYETLRQMARSRMARESPGQTLQATALVHEAYLRLVQGKATRWENRRHFYGAASEAMRRILIERARRVRRLRHGGHLERVAYEEAHLQDSQRSDSLLALDESLARFETLHPRKAEVVKLRFFVGMTLQETAETLDVSLATVKEDWRFARAWLNSRMRKDGTTSGSSRPQPPPSNPGGPDDDI